ncbi:MAG: NUDIX hydrolase [Bacilli bacterium]|nr:NUDIX hydrolase [Bacilli bacterium]
MEVIINNKDNLKDDQINEVVKRVKVLLVNSSNEMLLGYSHNTYQFIGGHVEDEEFEDAIVREVKEETGIELSKNSKYTPFAILNGYYKDWPNVGVNRKTEIYYYEVQTDLLPNLSNTSYTEHEKSGDFELRYVKVDDLLMEINHNAFVYGDEKGIAKEMLELLKIYFNNKK